MTDGDDLVDYNPSSQRASGLTKREAFTLAAMQGLCADPNFPGNATTIARDAIKVADEVIALLNEAVK